MKIGVPNAVIDWLKGIAPVGVFGWAYRQSGGRKWLHDRALHVPESAVGTIAAEAAKRAGLSSLTPVQQVAFWRGCESTLADAVDGKLLGILQSTLGV